MRVKVEEEQSGEANCEAGERPGTRGDGNMPGHRISAPVIVPVSTTWVTLSTATTTTSMASMPRVSSSVLGRPYSEDENVSARMSPGEGLALHQQVGAFEYFSEQHIRRVRAIPSAPGLPIYAAVRGEPAPRPLASAPRPTPRPGPGVFLGEREAERPRREVLSSSGIETSYASEPEPQQTPGATPRIPGRDAEVQRGRDESNGRTAVDEEWAVVTPRRRRRRAARREAEYRGDASSVVSDEELRIAPAKRIRRGVRREVEPRDNASSKCLA